MSTVERVVYWERVEYLANMTVPRESFFGGRMNMFLYGQLMEFKDLLIHIVH